MATERTSTPQAVAPWPIGEQGIASIPPQHLLTRAQLFDDPASYRAGVCEAFEWMARHGNAAADRARTSSAEQGVVGMTVTDVPTPETLLGCDDDLPTPRCGEWLVAYALGLAHTTNSRRDAVDELLTTAKGSQRLLREAREHLASLTHIDRDLWTRTNRLLTAAVTASSRAAARGQGPAGDGPGHGP